MNKSNTVGVRLPESHKQLLDALCKVTGRTMTDIVLERLIEGMMLHRESDLQVIVDSAKLAELKEAASLKLAALETFTTDEIKDARELYALAIARANLALSKMGTEHA